MKSMFKQTGTVPTETLFNNNKPLDVRGAYKGVINMYKQKLKELGNVDGLIKKCNIDIDLQQEFKDNSIKFDMTVSEISKLLSRTKYIEPLAYAACVENVAETFDTEYVVKFAVTELKENTEKIDSMKQMFDKTKSEDNEHPLEMNSIFIVIDDKNYESYKNKPSVALIHIDELDDEPITKKGVNTNDIGESIGAVKEKSE